MKTCELCDGGLGAGDKGPRLLGALGAAADEPEECEDVWPDDCAMIAENNYCHEPSYEGKCCKSCKVYEETKGDCFDAEKGCAFHNTDNYMCENYGDKCKKTCKKCE